MRHQVSYCTQLTNTNWYDKKRSAETYCLNINGREHVLEDCGHQLHLVRVTKVVKNQKRSNLELETGGFGRLLHGNNIFGERVGLDLEGQGGSTGDARDSHVGAVLGSGEDYKVCDAQWTCDSDEISQAVVFAFLKVG